MKRVWTANNNEDDLAKPFFLSFKAGIFVLALADGKLALNLLANFMR
ncbi:MAG TPA: hypothetical protein VFV38_27475 [Ktedonobacteraceae bacterium]|nr:hypothetical protein [Ktedonobacteraceae bacterium]